MSIASMAMPSSSMPLRLSSFNDLVNFNNVLMERNKAIDTFDMGNLSWFDACLCSPLGAVLFPYLTDDSKIAFGRREKLAGILRRNNFSKQLFNDPDASEHAPTAVHFNRFGVDDEHVFMEYVTEFCTPGLREFPKMTPNLLKKFQESMWELFNNSLEHSETIHGIFACGQLYPTRHKLTFAVTDRGIGVVERIFRSLAVSKEPHEALSWIFKDGTTTRIQPDSESGGFGLKFIRDFVDINGGTLFFGSGYGYYQRCRSVESFANLPYPFPGTSVIIEIDTIAHSGYKLSNE